MKAPPLPLWRMSRVRYDRLVDVGIFGPEDRVELLDGLLVAREPQGRRHAVVVVLVRAVLEKAFGPAYHVREEKPIALDERSEPEPDVVVVPGQPRDYLDAHPSRPVLLVEVAETSLAIDRLRKGGLYARARIADYWVVNLIDEVLEVYREPIQDPAGPGSWTYRSVRLLRRNAVVTPLAAPRARIRVAALLP
jgi:Uma2 family endonuclease